MSIYFSLESSYFQCTLIHNTYKHVLSYMYSVRNTVLQTDNIPLVHVNLILMWTTKTEYLLAQLFYLTFRHGQTHAFLRTTKFQSEQVNLKSYLPSLTIHRGGQQKVLIDR